MRSARCEYSRCMCFLFKTIYPKQDVSVFEERRFANQRNVSLSILKTYDLKIIIINHYFLIRVKFQFLKEMYSSNQFLVNMQHWKKFRFDDEDQDDKLFFDSSVDHIIKQFENVLFSVSLIKIIRKKSICYTFKNLFIVIFIFWWRLFIQLRIRCWWHFFIRTRNLIAKLFILWIRIMYD
jgi:hypothetical protein